MEMKDSKTPSVGIIMLNWNQRVSTLESLESLMKIDYGNLEVLLVDNGSSDGSVSAVKERFPNVHIIDAGKNLGCAGGRKARFELKKITSFMRLKGEPGNEDWGISVVAIAK